MDSSSTGGSGADAIGTPGPRRAPGRGRRAVAAIAVVVVLIVAGYAGYATLATRGNGEPKLVIYTYGSLLGGSCGGANTDAVFAPFEAAHHVQVELECPAGTLASTLIAEANAPAADLVVGLDEITASQADAAGVLVPYTPPTIASVPPELVAEISPDHAVTPYEWGYLGLDYCPAFANATHGAVGAFNFPGLAANSSWAKNLLLEDPATDIVGEEFLLWEIQFYAQVLHQPWQPFWSAVAPGMSTVDSWDTGFGEYTCAAGSPQLFASYANDAAYSSYFGMAGGPNSTVSWWNGTAYGWKTVYGVGIVRGSPHLSLDQAFIDWFLEGGVQGAIPTTEWEFPANDTVGVPSAYAAAVDPASVHALNDGVSLETVRANLNGWVTAWQNLVNGAG